MTSFKTNQFLPMIKQSRHVLVTVIAVFFFTSLILIIAGAPPLAAYYHIFKGSLGSWLKFAHVIKAWIPLTLCACGLIFTFRIGLWNIGIEGQVMMGAIFSTAALRFGLESQMPAMIISSSIVAGLIGGALWALFAGFLKTKGDVNEIFAGLGLNFVAQGIILWLIFGPWKRPGVASMSGTEVFPPHLWLSQMASIRLSPPALAIVCVSLILTALILRYTKIGLNLKAIGSNPSAAYLFGLKPARNMVLAMIFAGGFAGIAGSLQVVGVYHRLLPAISQQLRVSGPSGCDAGELQHLAGAAGGFVLCLLECRQHPAAHGASAGFFFKRCHSGSPGAGNSRHSWLATETSKKHRA